MARKKKSKAAARLEALVGELTFGSNLRSIRMAEELTQEQFAEKLDISAQHLCAIEKGTKASLTKNSREGTRSRFVPRPPSGLRADGVLGPG